MRRRRTISLILAIALMASLAAVPFRSIESAEALLTVDKVLERYIEAVGGRDALENLTTRECSGLLTDDLSARTPPVYTETQFAALSASPDRCLVMYKTGNSIYRAGYDGTAGWREDSLGVHDDEDFGKDKLCWLLNPRNALCVEDYFPELFVRGTEMHGDTTVVVLESKQLDKTHFSLHFDTSTGLLVQIGNYWYLQDYREVDGVLLPYRIVTGRKGGQSVYDFRQVRHNMPFSDSIFVAPVPQKE